MTAREVLDGIKNQLAAATPGPWETMRSGLLGTRVVQVDGEWEGIIPDEFVTLVTPALRKPTDAEFIAAAPSTVARLTGALEAVLAVHAPEQIAVHEGFGAEVWCPACRVYYPCPTVTAIEGALKEGQ